MSSSEHFVPAIYSRIPFGPVFGQRNRSDLQVLSRAPSREPSGSGTEEKTLGILPIMALHVARQVFLALGGEAADIAHKRLNTRAMSDMSLRE